MNGDGGMNRLPIIIDCHLMVHITLDFLPPQKACYES